MCNPFLQLSFSLLLAEGHVGGGAESLLHRGGKKRSPPPSALTLNSPDAERWEGREKQDSATEKHC